MGRDACILIREMIERFGLIEVFTEGMTREDFLEDVKTQYAVISAFIQIGEAARILLKKYIRDVPLLKEEPFFNLLRGLQDFRNFLNHQYARIDPSRVWQSIEEENEHSIGLLKDLLSRVQEGCEQ